MTDKISLDTQISEIMNTPEFVEEIRMLTYEQLNGVTNPGVPTLDSFLSSILSYQEERPHSVIIGEMERSNSYPVCCRILLVIADHIQEQRERRRSAVVSTAQYVKDTALGLVDRQNVQRAHVVYEEILTDPPQYRRKVVGDK